MSILSKEDIIFFIEILPKAEHRLPDIYTFEKWKDVYYYTEKRDLYREYRTLQNIVKSKTLSSYNYEFQKIFIYFFNLPYENQVLKKLHSIFCLYHEIHHHEQYTNYKERFYKNLPEPKFYNNAWTEKDANQYATEWMRKNRTPINQRLNIKGSEWDIGIIENRLRVYFY